MRLGVKDQQRKSAEAVLAIVQHVRCWRRESVVAAVRRDAAVPCKTSCMIAEVKLPFRTAKIPIARDELGLAVAFESVSRDDVKNRKGAVAVCRRISSALDLEIVHVLWVKLRSH